jgi:predicted NAD/FAD-binding protein
LGTARLLAAIGCVLGPKICLSLLKLRLREHRISCMDRRGMGMRVAVIGTGIAGMAAAWSLSKRYPVTVYDRELRPGGHSHTVSIDYEGAPVAVDIGFIVYNELNYPDLTALFSHLGVQTTETSMSFSVSADQGRFEWKGGGRSWRETAAGLFAQPRNLLSPSYLRMLRDILAFNSQSVEDSAAGRLADLSLGEYLELRQFAPRLLTDYLGPMGAAIWSAPAGEMLNFPAENFVAFFNNHRLLHYDRPVWRTVTGGSRNYVERLTAAFRNRIRFGCAVTWSDERRMGWWCATDRAEATPSITSSSLPTAIRPWRCCQMPMTGSAQFSAPSPMHPTQSICTAT